MTGGDGPASPGSDGARPATPGRSRGGLARARRSLAARLRAVLRFGRSLLALVVLWAVVARLEVVPEQALPHVHTVATTLAALVAEGTILSAAALTLSRAAAALAIATVVGVAVGVAMARSRILGWFLDPIVSVGFPVPKVTLVPVYLLWFGFGTPAVVALAATTATFPVVIATSDGARAVGRELVWSARTMDVSRPATTWKVVLPAALPDVCNGVQIAVFVTFVVVLVTEMVSSGGGLGQRLVLAVRFHRTAEALSYLVVSVGLGVATDGAFRVLRAHLLRWTD